MDGWLRERENARNAERATLEAALVRHRNRLAALDRMRRNVEAHYRSLVPDNDDLAATALRQLAQVEADRDAQQQTVEDA